MNYFQFISLTFFIQVEEFAQALPRDSSKSPIPGIQNWVKLSQGYNHFTPRHSHATCIYSCPHSSLKNCIWLTGGYSDTYRTFDLELTERNADVWYSEDGSKWNPMLTLDGDFLQGVGNHDAKVGGRVAPWYARYGHSLNAMDANGDGIADAMVLTGGFNPIASNDVWISTNGTTWKFDGYAPWAGRAYHGAIVYKEKLWIIGGSPLKNDVWTGKLVEKKINSQEYLIEWKLHSAHLKPGIFSPRAAFCLVTQKRRDTYDSNTTAIDQKDKFIETLFLIGGFGGYPEEDKRTRNDVWTTNDGVHWNQLFPTNDDKNGEMPWGARGWHACATWHDPLDSTLGVNEASKNYYFKHMPKESSLMYPKIYIIGGGYFGTHGNNVVRYLEGYVDVWWSVNGSNWQRVDYEEGEESSLYSTSEIYNVEIDEKTEMYKGKWGHTLEVFNSDLPITYNLTMENCASYSSIQTKECKQTFDDRDMSSALIVIGGDTTDGGPIVNDVFMSGLGGKFISLNSIYVEKHFVKIDIFSYFIC